MNTKKTAQNTLEFYVKEEIVKQNNKKILLNTHTMFGKMITFLFQETTKKNLQKKDESKAKII